MTLTSYIQLVWGKPEQARMQNVEQLVTYDCHHNDCDSQLHTPDSQPGTVAKVA